MGNDHYNMRFHKVQHPGQAMGSKIAYMGKIAAEPVKEIFELPPGCEMSVRFRKDQIDKASKDTSGRFVASLYFLGKMFLLTLLWRR